MAEVVLGDVHERVHDCASPRRISSCESSGVHGVGAGNDLSAPVERRRAKWAG